MRFVMAIHLHLCVLDAPTSRAAGQTSFTTRVMIRVNLPTDKRPNYLARRRRATELVLRCGSSRKVGMLAPSTTARAALLSSLFTRDGARNAPVYSL
ncbi:hypothetical protein HDK77DRAFT_291694 [Phyllosticta capitalensis]